jgi:ClpA/ClpB-like protein
MPSFDDLRRRGCMGDVIQLVGQVPDCLAMRSSVDPNDGSFEVAVLWMLLAWGRRFWTAWLEELGIDVPQLRRELDGLLGEKRSTSGSIARTDGGPRSWSPESCRQLDQSLDALLDRAAREASAFGHDYLGNEHLLLAILAQADGPLAELLSRHEIHYREVKEVLTDVLSRVVPAGVVEEPKFVIPPRKPWRTARYAKPATGVPRRFSMAALFAMMTLYAVIFAIMQSLDTNPVVFTAIAVLLTGVGAGQTLLFGGKLPRISSVCAGAVLFPLEIMAAIVYYYLSSPRASFSPADLFVVFIAMVFCIPLGGFLGYLAGGLAGGVFVLLDLIAKRTVTENDEQNQEE